MNAATDMHSRHMARALALAALGRCSTQPNPRVGCVIVKDGKEVGEGWHARAGEPHAEVLALRAAGERARGADLYVTLEPCSHHGRTPPCADALLAAGVRRVWAAMRDPNPKVSGAGFERLRAAGIEVHEGLMAAEAAALNRGFVSRMTRGRPWLTLKLAASLDGRTAMASGESRWITGAESRADVHRLRAEAGSVLTSSATVLADDPALTVRNLAEPPPRACDRIVLDARARVPATGRVWAPGARRLWLTAQAGAAPDGVERIVCPARGAQLDLAAAMQALGAEQINEVLVECGPGLAGALLHAQLVDELVVYLAPRLLGDGARPLARLPGLQRLEQSLHLSWQDVRPLGADLCLTALPKYSS